MASSKSIFTGLAWNFKMGGHSQGMPLVAPVASSVTFKHVSSFEVSGSGGDTVMEKVGFPPAVD